MQQLIAKHCSKIYANKRPRIIVTSFNAQPYNVSQFRPECSQYSTVYETLNINDHIVANTLFDQRRIESILLVPEFKAGFDIIEQNGPDGKCNDVYLLNGDNLKGTPSFRHYSCPNNVKAIYFIENAQDIIQSNTNEIIQLNKNVSINKEELMKFENEKRENEKLKRATDSELQRIGKECIHLRSKLRDAKNIEVKEPVDLEMFQVEIDKYSEVIKKIEDDIQEIESNSSEKKDEYDKALHEKEKVDEELKKYSEQIQIIKASFAEIEEKKEEKSEEVKHYRKLLATQIEKDLPLDENIKRISEDVERFTEMAIKNQPTRIETKRSVETITNEQNALEKQIAAAKRLHGDEQAIISDYKAKKEKFFAIRNDIKKQKKFLENLRIQVEKREQVAINFRNAKALICSLQFTNYVHSRNFTGHLKFDHDEQKLDVIVNTNKTRNGENQQATDLKALSGGERSFSTVAFLLSLWAIVESPILFLDEFDVFMDSVARSFALELILEAAKEKLHGQYMFLTPQDMEIKKDKYVKYLKMPDPKRNIDMHNNREKENVN
jgi:structural maintenance of chromosomes protein 6